MPKRMLAWLPEMHAEAVVHLGEIVTDVEEAAGVEHRCGRDQHRRVDDTGESHRDHHVDELEAEDPALGLVRRAHEAMLCERGVQIDHVRHHGCAEDADRQQHALLARERRVEPAQDVDDSWLGEECLRREREDDHADQTRDHGFEAAEAARLEREDREGRDARQHTGEEEGDAEEEVEAERGADELCEVGRHGDRLGLNPETERDRTWKAVAAHLRQVLPRRDAQLGAHRLDQHRHQVRGDDHPEQQVAELGAAGHVRREVAGVDVGDAGDEGRPEEGPKAPHPSPLTCERLRGRSEHSGLAGQDVFGLDDPRRVRLYVGLDDRVSHES